jgi:hypothetical protein
MGVGLDGALTPGRSLNTGPLGKQLGGWQLHWVATAVAACSNSNMISDMLRVSTFQERHIDHRRGGCLQAACAPDQLAGVELYHTARGREVLPSQNSGIYMLPTYTGLAIHPGLATQP